MKKIQKEYIPLLQQCFLFGQLKKQDLNSIAREVEVADYPKDTVILTQDMPGDSLYIITSGVAKVAMHDGHGRHNALTYLAKGDAFGEISVFAGENCTANVTAFTDLSVITLSKDKITKLTCELPNLAYNIIQALCERIREADQMINDLAFKNLEGRVAAKLLSLAEKFGEKEISDGTIIELPITHSDIAELVGTSRETVTKIISIFKKEGSIIMEDKNIVITNRKKLKSWTQQ